MPTKRRHEGYLLIDHSNAPGVPLDLLAAAAKAGKVIPHVRAGEKYESATITCAHCNVVVILNPNRTRERGYCAKCNHYVCDNPACNRECIPFKKVLDELQEQASLQA